MSAIRPLSPAFREAPTQDQLEDLFEDAISLTPLMRAQSLKCGHTFSASSLAGLRELKCSICTEPFTKRDIFNDDSVDGFVKTYVETTSSTDSTPLVSGQSFKLLQKPVNNTLSLINVNSEAAILEVHVVSRHKDIFHVHILANPDHLGPVSRTALDLQNSGIFFLRDDRTIRRPFLEEFTLDDTVNLPYSTAIIRDELTFTDTPFIGHAIRCLFLLRNPRPIDPQLFHIRSERIDQAHLEASVTADTFYNFIFRNNTLSKEAQKALYAFVPPKDKRAFKPFLGCQMCKKTHLLTKPYLSSRCGHVGDSECFSKKRSRVGDTFHCSKKSCRLGDNTELVPHILYGKALETLKPKKPFKVECGYDQRKATSRARLRMPTPNVDRTNFTQPITMVDTTYFLNLSDTPRPRRHLLQAQKKPVSLSMVTFSSFEASSFLRQIHVLSDLKKHYVLIVRLNEANYTRTLYDLKRLNIVYKISSKLPRNYIIFTHNDHDNTKKFYSLIEDQLDMHPDKKTMLREYACIDYQEGALTKLFKNLSI